MWKVYRYYMKKHIQQSHTFHLYKKLKMVETNLPFILEDCIKMWGEFSGLQTINYYIK